MPLFLRGLGRLIKLVFGTLAVLTLILAVGTYALYYHFTKDLPKLEDISNYNPPIVSEVFSDDGTKVGEFWQEYRFVLPYDQIPEKVIQAFVASEDERFWDHKGVDFRSIFRAFIKNLRAGKVVEGGSTITQQVTRAFLLTREKSFDRKIKEAILATQIEKNLTKEEILYLYLNQIFLGNRAYGVQAAARNYFRKDLKDLNIAEISIIAGLPSAPTDFAPTKSFPLARQRQLHVLNQMLSNGYITEKEYREALNTRLTIYKAGIDKDFNKKNAPYFVEHVRRMIEEKYGQEKLNSGGLKIYTTLDLNAYKAADKAVKQGLYDMEHRKGFRGPVATIKHELIKTYAEAVHKNLVELETPIIDPPLPNPPVTPTPLKAGHIYKGIITEVDSKGIAKVMVGNIEGTITPQNRAWIGKTPIAGDVYWVLQKENDQFSIEQEPKLESALFSFNPLNGEVKAMIGGYNYEKSEFDRATQALRQPGSSFKPIIYSASLDKGYKPSTTILDAPITYQIGKETWSPKNYANKYNGPMTLRSALTNSINIVAVKIFHDIKIDYAVAYARKMGILSPIRKYLSSALGASDVTLQEMTRAYGIFAAGGVRQDLIFIRKITDSHGKLIEENSGIQLDPQHVFDQGSQVIPQDTKITLNLQKEIEDWAIKYKLKLKPEEKDILYGPAIPYGHVITPRTAMLMVSIMKDVIDHGTGFKAKALGRPVAGKTGTTNDESDAWFIAYTPNIVTGVWLGYDSRKPIGPKMTGGVVSAPIWLSYMQEVVKGTPILDFAFPKDLKQSDIDDLKGGSAIDSIKPEPDEDGTPPGPAPASRGVDFLYHDL